jgi:hypothetical protein
MVAILPFFKPLQGRTGITRGSTQYGKIKQKKTDGLWKYFEDKGLTVQDLPKAIVCHELLGALVLALTWSSCYYFPPSQSQYIKEPIARMLALVPDAVTGPVKSNGFLSSRLGASYIESACVRKLLRPIMLPSKLYLTYKMVQMVPDIPLPGLCSHSSQGTAEQAPEHPLKPTTASGCQSKLKLRGGYCGSDDVDWATAAEHDFRSYRDDCRSASWRGGPHVKHVASYKRDDIAVVESMSRSSWLRPNYEKFECLGPSAPGATSTSLQRSD